MSLDRPLCLRAILSYLPRFFGPVSGEYYNKYLKEVTPSKRGHKSETLRLNRILRSPLAWSDKRLTEVSSDSVIREWSTISHIMTTAVKEWRYLSENYMLRLKNQ